MNYGISKSINQAYKAEINAKLEPNFEYNVSVLSSKDSLHKPDLSNQSLIKEVPINYSMQLLISAV